MKYLALREEQLKSKQDDEQREQQRKDYLVDGRDFFVNGENCLIGAKDHVCRNGMPRVDQKTGKITYNKQMHRIRFSDGSDGSSQLLQAAMDVRRFPDNPTPAVNSVHWVAPNPRVIPHVLEVSAWSVEDPKIQPANKKVESGTVEAFESRNGAPILGIQWHPEAYTRRNVDHQHYPQQHQQILKYMAVAGNAYLNRCAVVDEIKSCIVKVPEYREMRKVSNRQCFFYNSNERLKRQQLLKWCRLEENSLGHSNLSMIHKNEDIEPWCVIIKGDHEYKAKVNQQRQEAPAKETTSIQKGTCSR